jgi:uncharacterized protein YegP (UPF0339 family)
MWNFTLYQDAKAEWRWRLRASNGRIIADSGEGYQNIGDAQSAITLLAGVVEAQKYRIVVATED